MVNVHLCLFNYCLLLSVSQVSLLFSFDGSALTLCSLLFLKDALSMMCFIPLQPSLFTLFSLSLLAKQEVGCQDCNLKDVRTITLNTRHHVTRRQFKKEKRDIKHQTADWNTALLPLAFCSIFIFVERSLVSTSDVQMNSTQTHQYSDWHASFHKIEKATAPKKRKTEKG